MCGGLHIHTQTHLIAHKSRIGAGEIFFQRARVVIPSTRFQSSAAVESVVLIDQHGT